MAYRVLQAPAWPAINVMTFTRVSTGFLWAGRPDAFSIAHFKCERQTSFCARLIAGVESKRINPLGPRRSAGWSSRPLPPPRHRGPPKLEADARRRIWPDKRLTRSATKPQPLRSARTGSAASSKDRVSSATCAAISRKRRAEPIWTRAMSASSGARSALCCVSDGRDSYDRAQV